MKQLFGSFLVLGVLSCFTVGCGGEKASEAVRSDGTCSDSFNKDYNATQEKISSALTLKEMRGHINALQSDYAGVKCKDADGDEVNVDQVVSNANTKLDNAENKVRQAGYYPESNDALVYLQQQADSGSTSDHQQQVQQQNNQWFMDQSQRDQQQAVANHQAFVDQTNRDHIDQTYFPNF